MEAHGLLFCKDCNNYLFLKNSKDEQSGVVSMINYCKNCGYTYSDKHTGKKIEEIQQVMERDRYFSAEEAVEFGLIDKIVESRKT